MNNDSLIKFKTGLLRSAFALSQLGHDNVQQLPWSHFQVLIEFVEEQNRERNK